MNSDQDTQSPLDIVDGYFHTGIDKYLPFDQIRAAHQQHGIVGGIAVQHVGAPNNDHILEEVRKSEGAYRAVLMTDFTSPTVEKEMAAIAAAPGAIGVRIICDAGNGWPGHAELVRSHGLCPWLFFYHGTITKPGTIARTGIADVLAYLRSNHDRTVITHAVRAADGLGDSDLDALAANEHVVLMTTTPIAEEPGSLTARVLDRFGNDRVIWGSNYPNSPAIDLDWLNADVDHAETVAKAGANARRWWW